MDAYEPLARAFGDEKTVGFLLQARMYAYLNLGRLPEALAAGEELLSHHEATGATVATAKTLADQAGVYLDAGQVTEAMRCLARAELLLEQTPVRGERYVSALNSLVAAALDAELYERAAAAYRQLSQLWTGAGRTSALEMYEFTYGEVLLEWGLRLATSVRTTRRGGGCAARRRSSHGGATPRRAMTPATIGSGSGRPTP